MGIAISVASNVAAMQSEIRGIAQKQVRFATARALTDVARQAQQDVQAEMRKVFDNPTPWVLRGVRTRSADKNNLSAQVSIESASGKGVAPSKILAAEIEGGARRQKRFERALQAKGMMPGGYVAVPAAGAPLDGSGNIPGAFLGKLLSYFQAFGEQGYKANMTAKRMRGIHKVKVSTKGYKTYTGVAYFISKGQGKNRHLRPGIYAKTGTHGADVTPIIMFVPQATYQPRLDFEGVVRKSVEQNFPARMRARLAEAQRTAR
ncbi:hypothetical protein [Achromobacter sp. AONIH1]|uniref:hypothetical protein n=1 Tax=Achromobacter sp. AONIH1 TaxID=1758194 RepID=UPI001319EBF9|nr:hypothetical protein [Achromobacter sp. AONIH1]